MKSAHKLKEKIPSKKQRLTAKAKVKKVSQADQDLMLRWQVDLDSLMGQEFASIDEAMYALIDRVLERCNSKQELVETTREFLFDALDTDPSIKDKLRSILKTKS